MVWYNQNKEPEGICYIYIYTYVIYIYKGFYISIYIYTHTHIYIYIDWSEIMKDLRMPCNRSGTAPQKKKQKKKT